MEASHTTTSGTAPSDDASAARVVNANICDPASPGSSPNTTTSATSPATPPAAAPPDDPLGFFGRYLTLWVAIAGGLGVLVGYYAPEVPRALNEVTVAQVSLPIAVFIWLMVFPMLTQIDLLSLRRTRHNLRPLLITTCTNYLIQPFTMYALARFFFDIVFRDVIGNSALASEYLAGAVILGGSPCTAMVFVWSYLVHGDAAYTLVQVVVNDLLIFVLYVPTLMMLLETTDVRLPWDTAFLSVVLFMLVPGLSAMLVRWYAFRYRNEAWLKRVEEIFKPITVIALVGTLFLIFTYQAEQMIDRPVHVLLTGVPLLLQSYAVFGIAYVAMWWWNVPFRFAAPGALIATSNFFELAVAVALSLLGADSGATLVTAVGALEEVPVMLSLVWLCNHTRSWFPDVHKLDRYLTDRRAELALIPPARADTIRAIASAVAEANASAGMAHVVFVCQHNSRRSQFSEVWLREAAARADVTGMLVSSAGLSETAVDKRTIAALQRAGFATGRPLLKRWHTRNPRFTCAAITEKGDVRRALLFSKTVPAGLRDKCGLVVVTVCGAKDDGACPYVAGAAANIAMPYADPGEANGTAKEDMSYDEASAIIAREMSLLVQYMTENGSESQVASGGKEQLGQYRVSVV